MNYYFYINFLDRGWREFSYPTGGCTVEVLVDFGENLLILFGVVIINKNVRKKKILRLVTTW